MLEMMGNETHAVSIYSDYMEGDCMVVTRTDMDTGVQEMSFYTLNRDELYEEFQWGQEVFSYDASNGICEWDYDVVDDPRWDEMMGDDFDTV